MSSFLDRFIGKTQTISKMGPQQMLKGNDQNIIYTNTNKSFERVGNSRRINIKHYTKESQKEEESAQGDTNLHLPHLEQRFMDSQMRKKKVEQQNRSRAYLDKETNWIIQQPSPTLKIQQNQNMIASVDTHNTHSLFRQKEEKRLKSQHIKKSMGHLGGLGPNIGGQQWLLKKQKQQKIKKYANQLKKVHRSKLKKEAQDDINILMGGGLIHY